MAAASDDLSARLRRVELDTQSATDRIKSHEEICAERYRSINENLGAVRSTQAKVAWALIAGMGGILVKLVFFG
jgi:tRNA A22 N-methylase